MATPRVGGVNRCVALVRHLAHLRGRSTTLLLQYRDNVQIGAQQGITKVRRR